MLDAKSIHGDYTIAQVSIGSATTEEIVYQTQYWTGFNPDLTIFQLGLCDCLPRALRSFELEIVKRLPQSLSIRKWIAKHSRALRELRGGITRTDPELFGLRVDSLKSAFPKSIWLEILVNADDEPENFPRCVQLAQNYNRAIRQCYGEKFLELTGIGREHFMDDGFHLNREGHGQVWKELRSIVENVK